MGDRDGRGAQAVWLQGLYLDPVQRHERAFYQVPSTWHRAGSAKGPFYPGAALPMHTSMRVSRFSHFRLFATLWAVACQASPSKGFSRQEYWSGLPCPPPGILPDPGIEPVCLMSPALAGRFFTTRPSGKPKRKPNAVNTVEGSPHAKCKPAFGRVQRCLSSSRSPGTPSLSVELDRLRNASGGTSPVGQWLRVCTSATGGTGPIPGQETKILHAVQHSKKKKKKERKKWLWFKEDRGKAGVKGPNMQGFLSRGGEVVS